MELTATELTAKILPTRISRMRQEADPTTAAADRRACQARMLAQNGIQRQLILTNKPIGAIVQMPLFGIREEFPDARVASSAVRMFSNQMTDEVVNQSRYGALPFPDVTPQVNLPAGAGTVTVGRIGDDLVIQKDGGEVFRAVMGSILGVTLFGTPESEDFNIHVDGLDRSNLPYGLTIHAGEGVGDNDTLILTGSDTVTNYEYTTGGPESGTITLDGLMVAFSEFEPIIDELPVTNRKFTIGTSGSQQIVLRNDDAADGRSLIDDGGLGSFESLSFRSPTNSFDVKSGDESDTIIILPMDASFGTVMEVDAGGGDDTVDASAFNLPTVLTGGPGDDTLLGGLGADVIDGGDGNDIIDGGAGSDDLDGGTGDNAIVSDPSDGNLVINEDGLFHLAASFVDPQTAMIDWGDGASEVGGIDTSSGTVTGNHAYSAEGTYEIVVTVWDSVGAKQVQTLAVTVRRLVAQDGEVFFSSSGVVRIGGTSADDEIVVKPNGFGTMLEVSINGLLVRDDIDLAAVREIRAWGHDGNDHIALVDLALDAMLDGGAGDDCLVGGDGNDLIFGGAGEDHLIGGSGNDFLIGGALADRIVGGAGHDILVAGDVDSGFTYEALRQISRDWAAEKAPSDELVDEVLDECWLEAGLDLLTGSSGSDWFIINQEDKITDFKKLNKDEDLITYV